MLSLLFGVTHAVVSVFLRFGRRILIQILRKHEQARVKMPSGEEIESFKGAIKLKYPLLENVWCMADGLKLKIEQAACPNMQARFYNGEFNSTNILTMLNKIVK